MRVLLAAACLVVGVSALKHFSMQGDRVVRLHHDNLSEAQVKGAQALVSELDVWGHAEDGGLEVRITADQYLEMSKALVGLGLNVTDVTAQHETHLNWMADPSNNQLCTASVEECKRAFYDTYQTLPVIHSYLDDLASQHSTYIRIAPANTWGTSFEGRQQKGVIVTAPGGSNKPVVFYFCGEHAREWLPPMFCVFMAENLAARFNTDQRVRTAMTNYEFHILPVMNVDGYVFSNSNRMWRKSRRPNMGSTCIGTDLNRNYAYMFNTGGSSGLPCSDTYHGGSPWTNPETRNLLNYRTNLGGRMVVQTDVHAYGQMWMHPWGYTRTLSPDNTRQMACGTATVNAIRSVSGLNFRAGSIANVIYVASGSSCDDFYAGVNGGVVFSYAPEVRGTSFQPPISNIAPSNNELWAGMLAQVECAGFFLEHPEATEYPANLVKSL